MTTLRGPMRLIAALTLASAIAACSSDDGGGGASGDDAADTPVAQAIAEDMLADDDSGALTEDDARCVSGGIVSEIGEDRLADLGVTADDVGEFDDIDFTDDEIGVVVDSMFDCVDVAEVMAAELEADLGAETAQCVAERLDADLIREMMVSDFRGEDGAPPEGILDAMFECGTVTEMLVAEFEPQFGAAGARCLADNLGEDLLRSVMEASIQGEDPPPEFVQAFAAIAAECNLPVGG